ncbi:MAG: CYTH domain-containing protein [bacterium]|nr:CYTH domain-containing protein [bacterium]
MQSEIEATFLDINHDELRIKLRDAGAICSQPMHDMKRVVYDYEDLRLDKQAAWIRIRQEANKITMSFKQRQAETIEGMKEIEFEISDYEAACQFMESIGLKQKATQETRREVWQLENCEIMLDEWPWIPAYVEVEGSSEASVRKVSNILGFYYENAVFDSTDGIYQNYFDITRTEISTIPIVFGAVPEWLEAKRK